MQEVDPSLFEDVADALKISHPSIPEKDYYAIALLSIIANYDESPYYELIFSGGTCLSKAFCTTSRMSEDLDIKLVQKKCSEGTSKSKLKKERKKIRVDIANIINGFDSFDFVGEPLRRNEYKYQQLKIQYPISHHSNQSPKALRPYLQLELIDSHLFQEPLKKSISSMLTELQKRPPEISSILCVPVETTGCEKLISILRRTASRTRDKERADDERLIRHIYDLHLIYDYMESTDSNVRDLLFKIIEIDRQQFGAQHEEFKGDPINELIFGYEQLKSDPIYKERYERFIDPLVYNKSPAGWDEALETTEKLINTLLR